MSEEQGGRLERRGPDRPSDAERLRGRVSAIMAAKLFGFVAAGGKEFFFHASAMNKGKFEDLRTGDVVTFLPVTAEKGNRAVAVEVE